MAEKIQFLGRSRFLDKKERKHIRQSLTTLCITNNHTIESLVYVHQSDEELLQVNQRSLQHDTYTDIITFDLSDTEGVIDGEIYISVDRIKENASLFGVGFCNEYRRVLSHGLLHLMGFKDKTTEEKAEMRKQEDLALAIFHDCGST
ncbi:rRNA maturation RNase YbeY [Bacteroidia bacterium]|nr:rRNA maturation RNase YbeY [Bacteroidia bacterium]MDA9214117.1 rRNA maturation RNase YbeY [Bacteroidia bacterium]